MKQKWIVLIIICIGVFMSTLDGSILNIANPTIAADFKINMSQIQWVVTAYMLVVTATMLFFGKLGDKVGSNRLYTLGFFIFTIGSFLCSMSNNLSTLISSRIFQAVGASILMATGLGIVSNAFPANEKGKAIGITGAVVGIGNMSGPVIGGIILEHFGWPSIFIINIPIGIIAVFLGIKFLPKPVLDEQNKSFDIPGLLLFASCTTLILLAMNEKGNTRLYLGITALIIFLLLALREVKFEQSFIDLPLFKNRNFTVGNIIGVACYFPQMAVSFLLPFYLEQLKNLSPMMAGYVMTVHPLIMVLIAPIAGSLSDKHGAKNILTASFSFMTISLVGMALLKADSLLYLLIVCLVIFGLGLGAFSSPNNSSILADVPPQKQGYGGSFLATIRNLSFALGTAFFSSFFAQSLTYNQKFKSHTSAYVIASNQSYWIAASVCFIGLILTVFFMRKTDKSIS
ncbi:MFS transporter [Clostridioides difficile]|uniref:MFS transporter n=1 Tax=Clostridioides difficile TaxID=1496 RepID=UPI00038C80BF|nr:MFS transporter [Clostridioides difficile]EQG26938.1 H+ antiporter-2 family protein [Clostridioides difficile DA00126]